MPNKRSEDKQAVTVYVARDLRAAATAAAKDRGETLTAVLERALTEYVMLPPPDQPQPSGTV